jgi:hypothetical protein
MIIENTDAIYFEKDGTETDGVVLRKSDFTSLLDRLAKAEAAIDWMIADESVDVVSAGDAYRSEHPKDAV